MCMRQSLDFPNRIQSPLNYTGGKFRLLPQILPLFPANIDVLVDLFCGGGNVGINTSAERIVLNDSDKNVIRIFRLTYRVFEELSYIPKDLLEDVLIKKEGS